MSKQRIEIDKVFARNTAEECYRERYDTKTSIDAKMMKHIELVNIMIDIQHKEAAKGKPSLLDTNGRKSKQSVEVEMNRLHALAEQIYAERMQQGAQPEM